MREPSKGYTRELQVGIFIFAACLVIVAFSFRITDTPIFRKGTTLITYLNDATGVFKNSKVKMAGIDIGVIKTIELEGGKARITLLINAGVDIPKGAQIIPRPLGILGDKYLEVVVPLPPGVQPGEIKDDSGPAGFFEWVIETRAEAADAEAAPKTGKSGQLKEGEVIKSLDSPATLDDLTRQMGSIGNDLKAMSATLRKLVEGKNDLDSPVGRTLRNAEKLTENLNNTVIENRKDMRAMVGSLSRLSQKLERAFDGFDQDKVRGDIKRLADAAGNMTKSLENVEKITTRVEQGEGTIGKLINDPSTAEELTHALRSISNLVDRANRVLMVVDLSAEYMQKTNSTKSYIGIGVFPREDVGYLAALVVDPAGRKTVTRTTTVTNGAAPVVVDQELVEKDKLKFSAQFYKRIWGVSLRLGVFENTGGLGVDTYFFRDRLQLGTELFDFSRDGDNPHLKAYAKLRFLDYFYVIAGGDELAAKSNSRVATRSFDMGLGIRFSDEDLKTVALIPGLH